MGDNVHADPVQVVDRLVIDLEWITAADSARGRFMDRLQPKLHGHGLFRVDLRQQINHLGRKTVRARADRQPYDEIGRDRFFVQPSERIYIRVGVGERLKIRDIDVVGGFSADTAFCRFEPVSDRKITGCGELARSARAAKDTAACTEGAVAVGTGRCRPS